MSRIHILNIEYHSKWPSVTYAGIVWFLLLIKSLKCLERYLLLLIFVMVGPKTSIQRS